MERLVGEVGARVKSRAKQEANLFHKNHMLFCLRVVNSGMNSLAEEPMESTAGIESERGHETVSGASIPELVKQLNTSKSMPERCSWDRVNHKHQEDFES